MENNSNDQAKAFSEMLAAHKRELQLERVLDRAESKAESVGLLPEALDDAREWLGKKADITTANLGEYYAQLRKDRPHWFKAEAQNENNAKGEKSPKANAHDAKQNVSHSRKPSGFEKKIQDFGSLSAAEFRAFLKTIGVNGY